MISKYKYSLLAILMVIIFSSILIINKKEYKKTDSVIYWDIISYYAYLPATFIYDDVYLDFINSDVKKWGNKFWTVKTESNKNAIKTSMGMAYLYSPFFFIGHLYAKNSLYEPNGFTIPYKVSLVVSILFYYLIGLLYLVRILKIWFRDHVISIVIICLSFGTNLFWFSAYSCYPMPHIYNFTLFAIYIFYSIKWIEKQTFLLTIALGVLLGIISLIRPTNIIIVLVLFLWGVTSKRTFLLRIKLFFQQYLKIILMCMLFTVVWIPQLIYWKEVSGYWLYFSYGKEERFFFLTPEIINGLFSYRNGWLVYTPIMIFALYGIYLLREKFNIAFYTLTAFTTLNIYIILSWWCWWYVGFGNRAFIDSYALLSIPFAVFVENTLKAKKNHKILFGIFAGLLIFLNQAQTYQYSKAIIHWDSMNKNAYWAGFMKFTRPDTLNYLLASPDYNKAQMGITTTKPNALQEKESPFKIEFNEIMCNCERTDFNDNYFLSDNLDYYKFYCGKYNSLEKSLSGKQSMKLSKENPYGLGFIIKQIKPNINLEVTVWRSASSGTLVASDTESKVFYEISSKVIDRNNNGWEKIILKIKTPNNMLGKDLKIYVWNNEQKDSIFFDDISIKYISNYNK